MAWYLNQDTGVKFDVSEDLERQILSDRHDQFHMVPCESPVAQDSLEAPEDTDQLNGTPITPVEPEEPAQTVVEVPEDEGDLDLNAELAEPTTPARKGRPRNQ